MPTFSPCEYPILFQKAWRTTGFAKDIAALDRNALHDEYEKLVHSAPRRSDKNKAYFVEHAGKESAENSNRREEILAKALWKLNHSWPHPGGGGFRLLDYQFPLKAQQSDKGIGKVDLLGVTDQGRLMVIELKVKPDDGTRGETPMKALMEGLRYAAIVKANQDAIAKEAKVNEWIRKHLHELGICSKTEISEAPPLVQILAPKSWWEAWLNLGGPTRKAAGSWEPEFAQLLRDIEKKVCVAVECIALEGLDDSNIALGIKPHDTATRPPPSMYPIALAVDKAPASNQPEGTTFGSYGEYEEGIRRVLWDWADGHHCGELDGGKREGRPPVLGGKSVSKNVLLPQDAKAEKIRCAVSEPQRHRWFGSLKSSQALAQSVFGALHAFERLDLLKNVLAECGRPAFFEDYRGWTLNFEHEVGSLGEPRPTSVDVLLSGPEERVPIECKFTEQEFGTCSRPRLCPCDAKYAEQHCNGNYEVQRQRQSRCTLTEIGIRYWEHLPHLFDWSADRDLVPCPFKDVYQLARNALVAALTPDGRPNPSIGHALVVYDARNPEFRNGGVAEKQWNQAVDACRMPGLLRRLSWQRLMTAISRAPELGYLVQGISQKYGLEPD